jgi:hypothetical protein
VGEKVTYGHLRSDVRVRIVTEVLADWVVKRELSLLDELQRRDGGEHLVHRADAKARLERVRDVSFAIRLPVGVCEANFAVLCHEGRAAEPVVDGLLGQ